MIIEPLLGTRAEVVLTATEPEIARSGEASVVAGVRRLETIFSRFDEASALRSYRTTGTSVVPELLEVIDLADDWQRRTNGAFHPRAQPLVDLWDRAEVRGTPPSVNELQQAVEAMDSVPITATLDLNAIAKGWIADEALTSALKAVPGASAGWINLGGDIVHRGMSSLTVGIENPSRPYDNVGPLATVEVSNEAMATSGGAQRWWTIAGIRYPKVIDPRSGVPGEQMASATVVAGDGATADVLATVAVILDAEQTLALTAAVGASCFLVHRDGSITSSSDRFRPS